MYSSCGDCGKACLTILRGSTGRAIRQGSCLAKLVLHSGDAGMALKYAPSLTNGVLLTCQTSQPRVIHARDDKTELSVNECRP